jgi:hypothetical protein
MEDRIAQWRGDGAREAFAAAAERARLTLGVASLTIGMWEREHGYLRTLVNAGALGPGEEPRPDDEIYPVHTFPALVTLLERRTPYCFGPGDPVDVSSASLAARLGKESQGAAPIAWHGEVWGSLWVATVPGERPLTTADIPRIVRAANEVARVLDDLAAGAGQPPR